MIVENISIENFRGISEKKTIHLAMLNSIVGQNDAGKSTILKAFDAFLNDKGPDIADFNHTPISDEISIELIINCSNRPFFLGEEIETTLEKEELTDENKKLILKKVWKVSDSKIAKPKTYIFRKVYDGKNDFIFNTEPQLIKLCKDVGIDTKKGNGEEFNNVEKREKLRAYNLENTIEFKFDYDELPATGKGKAKIIGDAIKSELPVFEYFKADTSLSDSDNAIQKYFKDLAFKLIKEKVNTDELETTIRTQLGNVLKKVTDKINVVVKGNEKVDAQIDFDWSKLISTKFISEATENSLPLGSRGDGFRRITMMSYFEYLAESNRDNDSQQIIFGFEEPETFLHPSAQANLYHKLESLVDNDYQVIISTHSPTIVGNTNSENIIHISKEGSTYHVKQGDIDYKQIALDLGIKPDNTFTPLFSSARALLLVEGVSDVIALKHNSEKYKENGAIEKTFDELGVALIPLGSCGAVKHWVNLDLFTQLEKPFHIFLDSDKDNAEMVSPNEKQLSKYGLEDVKHYTLTKKRLLENYIHPDALKRLVPESNITYGDFDHAKNICKDCDPAFAGKIGGSGVAEKHYCSLTYDELRMTWFDGTEDEFLNIYNLISSKLN